MMTGAKNLTEESPGKFGIAEDSNLSEKEWEDLKKEDVVEDEQK